MNDSFSLLLSVILNALSSPGCTSKFTALSNLRRHMKVHAAHLSKKKVLMPVIQDKTVRPPAELVAPKSLAPRLEFDNTLPFEDSAFSAERPTSMPDIMTDINFDEAIVCTALQSWSIDNSFFYASSSYPTDTYTTNEFDWQGTSVPINGLNVSTMNPLQTFTSTPRTFAYSHLTDIKGNQLDVRALASQYYLVVITLKSVQCPVCPVLLQLINLCSGIEGTTEFSDPFTLQTLQVEPDDQKLYNNLLRKDAYYIVICPGPVSALRSIQEKTPFEHYPFIPDDDSLSIAKSMKLNMSSTEIWPGIIHISPHSLSMFPIYIGRGPGNYGIHALLKSLLDERSKWERRAFQAIKDASYQVDRIRRKTKKWQDTMAARKSCSNILPPEIIFVIIDALPDIHDVVRMRQASLLFNITACEVVISRLRHHSKLLISSVPPRETVEFDEQVSILQHSNVRLSDHDDDLPGLGLLRERVESAERDSSLVNQWVRSARPTLSI
ncbi:hypothetical protein Unana1_08073 [Umbelopsis nana]